MLRRTPCCSFFNKANMLYAVYWQQNPDQLTVEQFLKYLNPTLINNCRNVNLLMHAFQKKATKIIQLDIKELAEKVFRYNHYVKTNSLIYHSSSEVKSLELAAKQLEIEKKNLKELQAVTQEISQTGVKTLKQQEFLEAFVQAIIPAKAGTTSNTLLLCRRLLQLIPTKLDYVLRVF